MEITVDQCFLSSWINKNLTNPSLYIFYIYPLPNLLYPFVRQVSSAIIILFYGFITRIQVLTNCSDLTAKKLTVLATFFATLVLNPWSTLETPISLQENKVWTEFETRYTTITHALGEEVWEFIVGIELFVQSFAYWVNSFNISRFICVQYRDKTLWNVQEYYIKFWHCWVLKCQVIIHMIIFKIWFGLAGAFYSLSEIF